MLLLQLGPRAGPRRGRRRPRHQRVRARDERPVVRAERGERSARHRPDRPVIKTYGDKGRQILADTQAEADGINAYAEAHSVDSAPATVNDVIAVTAFIGSIFGAGGGAEASNAELLAKLQNRLGAEQGPQGVGGRHAVRRPRGAHHAHRTLRLRAAHRGPRPWLGRDRRGLDRLARPTRKRPPRSQRRPAVAADAVLVDADARRRRRKQASNFLVVDPHRSATRNTLAVMGPQLGYYYPEIVQQIHLSGPGIEAQGVAVPGLAMYILIGRTPDYAWSLTSANHDVRDVFAEQLCSPTARAPDARVGPLPVRRRVPAVRRVRRRHAQRHADPLPGVGARARDRHRDRRTASPSRSPASARRSGGTGSTSPR